MGVRRGRPAALVVAAVMLVAAVCGGAGPAAALSARSAALPGAVLPTAQLDGVAFAQIVIGDTVYVGGAFRTARPAGAPPRTRTVARRNLLAYDLATGGLRAWAPRTNGVVRALAASEDGRTVYAVGSFTRVDGQVRDRVVAIAAGDGRLRGAFHPRLNGTAAAIAVHGRTVYLGGSFTAANGVGRSYAAAVDRLDGVLRRWRPALDAPVLAVVVSKSGRSAVLGGRFDRVNGRTASGSQRVDTADGRKNLRWLVNRVVRNHGPAAAVYSLTSMDGLVVGTGYSYLATGGGRLEGAFVASWSGSVHWIEDCHGDSYSAAVTGSAVYVAGHAHDCSGIGGFGETDPPTYHRALAFTRRATGVVARNTTAHYSDFAGRPAPTLLDWFPDFDLGHATGLDQGPWSVVTSGDWVLFAGEFTTVDGAQQQGLVRFRG